MTDEMHAHLTEARRAWERRQAAAEARSKARRDEQRESVLYYRRNSVRRENPNGGHIYYPIPGTYPRPHKEQ